MTAKPKPVTKVTITLTSHCILAQYLKGRLPKRDTLHILTMIALYIPRELNTREACEYVLENSRHSNYINRHAIHLMEGLGITHKLDIGEGKLFNYVPTKLLPPKTNR